MRHIVIIAVLLALPLIASAQERPSGDRRSGPNRSEQRRSEAGRPAATSALPWWERQQAPWWERRQTPAFDLNWIPGYAQGNVARGMLDQQRNQQPHTGNRRRSRNYPPSVVYVLPQYRYFSESLPTATQFIPTPPPPAQPVGVEPVPPPPPMGALRLEVEPRESLQVFVDGVYLGTPADLGDDLELTTGTRRIELRATGYRSLTFRAEIVDGRSITYRGLLDREEEQRPQAPRTAAPALPTGSKVMYMIPGCYFGNVSPNNVTLRPGCDISLLTTISP